MLFGNREKIRVKKRFAARQTEHDGARLKILRNLIKRAQKQRCIEIVSLAVPAAASAVQTAEVAAVGQLGKEVCQTGMRAQIIPVCRQLLKLSGFNRFLILGQGSPPYSSGKM